MNLTGPSGGWTDSSRALWRRCVEAALDDGDAWQTPPRTGLPRLRQALAAVVGLDGERLAVTSGIRGQVPALLGGARTLLIERPSFQSIPVLARRQGVSVHTVDWEELLRTEGTDDGRVLWLTSPARNPDGRTLTRPEAARLDELAGRNRAVVVNQAYLWSEPGSPRPGAATLIGSLHKLAGGGCVLGWQWSPGGAGPDRPAGGGPPMAWQLAWTRFLEQDGLADLAEHGLHGPARRCRRFIETLPELAGVRVRYGGGPSLLLEIDTPVPEARLVATLAEHGVLVGAGTAFGCASTAVRLCFTGVDDDEVDICAHRVQESARSFFDSPAATERSR